MAILVYLCINLLNDYLDISNNLMPLNFSPWLLSIALTFAGIGIGGLLYFVSLSKKLPSKYSSKDYAVMATQIVAVVLLITMYAAYLSMNGDIQRAISFAFGIIGVPIFFIFIPIISF